MSLQLDQCGASVQPLQHVVAHFLITAYALVHADRLLTKGRGYYGRSMWTPRSKAVDLHQSVKERFVATEHRDESQLHSHAMEAWLQTPPIRKRLAEIRWPEQEAERADADAADKGARGHGTIGLSDSTQSHAPPGLRRYSEQQIIGSKVSVPADGCVSPAMEASGLYGSV